MGYNLKNARNGKSISEIPKWPRTRHRFPIKLGMLFFQNGFYGSFKLTHHDPKDLGLICLVKERKILFSDSFGFKNTI